MIQLDGVTHFNDGERDWYKHSDVCRVFGTDGEGVVLDPDGARYKDGDWKNGVFIDILNVASLALRSEAPAAEPVKAWVNGGVLPEIRETGGYAGREVNEDAYKSLFAALKAEEEPERVMLTLRHLMQKNGVPFPRSVVETLMTAKGLLSWSKYDIDGKVRYYPVLTEAGLRYGSMREAHGHPLPLYYEDLFGRLLEEVL